MEQFMNKVVIVFPETKKYGDRTFEAGEHEFDLDKEPLGFLSRWESRGCHRKVESEKVEAPREEPKEEPKKETKKKTKKKTSKKKSE